MPITREPRPLPSALDYVPPDTKQYKVANGETWWTLADRPEVKARSLSANDLCFLNFGTRKPAEINWYLYHKVGCRVATRDGKNYCFSSADTPGIVYLPLTGPPLPVNAVQPAGPRTNAWIGLAGNAGTQFGIIGIETLAGYVVSLDDVGKGMAIGASINRVGPGIGASGGMSVVFITGVKSPSDLNGHQQGGGDFNLSLGGNWSKLAQARKLKPLVDALNKVGARTPSGLKKAVGSDPDKWVELIKTTKSTIEFMGIDPNGEPNVFVLGTPAGAGVEASAFYGVSNFEAMWDFTE